MSLPSLSSALPEFFFFFSYLKGSFLFFFLHHFLHSQMLAQSRSKAFNSLLYKENWNWKRVACLALSVRKDTSKKRLKVSKHESVCTNILMPEYALLRCQPLPTFSVVSPSCGSSSQLTSWHTCITSSPPALKHRLIHLFLLHPAYPPEITPSTHVAVLLRLSVYPL